MAQTHQFEHFLHAQTLVNGLQVVQAKADIVRHIEVWKQRVILKHHANAARLSRQMNLWTADNVASQPNAAGGCFFQTSHGAQQRGFAAARRADQHANFARRQGEGCAVDRPVRPTGVVNAQL